MNLTIRSPGSLSELNEFVARYCRSPLVAELQDAWSQEMEALAASHGVDTIDVWRQACLHIPSFSESALRSTRGGRTPQALLDVIDARIHTLSAARSGYYARCGAPALGDSRWTLHAAECKLTSEDGRSLGLLAGPVSPEIGKLIESTLHYMQSAVHEPQLRAGLFLEGYPWPIAYMSVVAVDRVYKKQSLEEALSCSVDSLCCLNVARIHGFGRLPKNSISFLTKWVGTQLLRNGVQYLLTAVNPLLGFTGASTLAAGFRPYALSPVAYGYNPSGLYTPRRHNPTRYALTTMPPNILFIRGLSRAARRRVTDLQTVHLVSSATHRQLWSVHVTPPSSERFEPSLEVLRSELEQAWSRLTVYHRTTVEPDDPVSKGQCGVTSAFIARELQNQGYEVLFCEGDVTFPNGCKPIKNHCWVKLPSLRQRGKEIRDLIIDLTADQSGFEEAVICENDASLKRRGILYQQAREVEPRVVDAGHLSARLNALQDRISSLSVGD